MKTTEELEEQIEALQTQLRLALEAMWQELATLEEVVRAMRDPN